MFQNFEIFDLDARNNLAPKADWAPKAAIKNERAPKASRAPKTLTKKNVKASFGVKGSDKKERVAKAVWASKAATKKNNSGVKRSYKKRRPGPQGSKIVRNEL